MDRKKSNSGGLKITLKKHSRANCEPTSKNFWRAKIQTNFTTNAYLFFNVLLLVHYSYYIGVLFYVNSAIWCPLNIICPCYYFWCYIVDHLYSIWCYKYGCVLIMTLLLGVIGIFRKGCIETVHGRGVLPIIFVVAATNSTREASRCIGHKQYILRICCSGHKQYTGGYSL